ncbi:MAG: exodeoxyribonuclease VII small subunit [Candidatus Cybelea sp.]
MDDSNPKSFEAKLNRIDEIVKLLQSGQPSLEDSILLFKEGKKLSRECEGFLENAQQQIDEAMAEPQSGAGGDRATPSPELDDELPF